MAGAGLLHHYSNAYQSTLELLIPPSPAHVPSEQPSDPGTLSAAPAFLLATRIYGPGRRRSLLVMTGIATAFAVVAPALIFNESDPEHLPHAFNVMVLIGIVVMIGNMLLADNRRRPELRVLIVGTIISAIFIALEHLRNLGAFSIPYSTEWIGVTILYITLLHVTFKHFLTESAEIEQPAAGNSKLRAGSRIPFSRTARRKWRVSTS